MVFDQPVSETAWHVGLLDIINDKFEIYITLDFLIKTTQANKR